MVPKKAHTYLKYLQLKAAGLFKYVWLFSGYQVLNMKAKFSVIFSWKYGKYSKSNEKIPSKLCFCISLVKLSTIFTNTTEISLSNNISAMLWNAYEEWSAEAYYEEKSLWIDLQKYISTKFP